MDALGPFNFVLVTTRTPLWEAGTLLDSCSHLRETAGSLYCWGREMRGVGGRGRGCGKAVCRGSPARLPLQVSTVRMQGVILLLFAKYYHLPFLRDVQTDCTRTGLGGYWVSGVGWEVMGEGEGPECGLQDHHFTLVSFTRRPSPTQEPLFSTPRPVPSLAPPCLLFLSLELIPA